MVLIAIVTAQHPPTLVVWETIRVYSVSLKAANEQKGRVNTALIHSMFIPAVNPAVSFPIRPLDGCC